MRTRAMALVICLVFALGISWLSPSFVNSFDGGRWLFNPLPVGVPDIAFVGLCFAAGVMGFMYVISWLVNKKINTANLFIGAGVVGTIVLTSAMWIPQYFILTGYENRSISNCIDAFLSDGGKSFLMANLIFALMATTLAVTIGRKAFNFTRNPGGNWDNPVSGDGGNPNIPSAFRKTGGGRGGEGQSSFLSRIFRVPWATNRYSSASATP